MLVITDVALYVWKERYSAMWAEKISERNWMSSRICSELGRQLKETLILMGLLVFYSFSVNHSPKK